MIKKYILYLPVIGFNMARLRSILAANIKFHRKSLGLTQEKLAEMVNTAPTYIAMMLKRKGVPRHLK
jgi:predicted transcriptional regulator